MLKLNLYALSKFALPVLRSILGGIFSTRSHYAEGFLSVDIPSIAEVQSMPPGGEKLRGHAKSCVHHQHLLAHHSKTDVQVDGRCCFVDAVEQGVWSAYNTSFGYYL